MQGSFFVFIESTFGGGGGGGWGVGGLRGGLHVMDFKRRLQSKMVICKSVCKFVCETVCVCVQGINFEV